MPKTTQPARSATLAPVDRLRAIADSIPDRAFGVRLRKVFDEGARAINTLNNLPLGKYDELAETGAPTATMWEELAPVVRETMTDLNRLLNAVREHFPSGRDASEPLDALGKEGADTAQVLNRLHMQEAAQQIQALGTTLASEVANFSEKLKAPQSPDRWNLLADLQEFRGRTRTIVGDLLYLASSPFAPVRRGEVIPGYEEELRDALVTRRSITYFSRVMSLHSARIQNAPPSQIGDCVGALVIDLDTFGRSRSYTVLRTQDKRRFVEFSSLLHKYPAMLGAKEVVAAVVEFADFAQGLWRINRRAILKDHDREVLAACATTLEIVDQLRAEKPAEAIARFVDAVTKIDDVYGRHPSLDAYLRAAKKRDLAALSPTELAFEVELLRGLLAAATAL